MNTFFRSACLISMLTLTTGAAQAEVDWSAVQGRDINLFYPATMSWERLFTPRLHSGQTQFKEGKKDCVTCHGDLDEAEMGKHLIKAGGFIEPRPIEGKPPFIKANVKMAHDADTFYVRVAFDPGDQPASGMDPDYETKVALMIDDGSVPEATRAGCWVSCHADVNSMTTVEMKATKYLAVSRTAMNLSGSEGMKSDAEIAKLRADGHFLEYWQARLKSDGTVDAVDGSILEKRSDNTTSAVTATATTEDGLHVVTFARKMIAGAPYKDIVPKKRYTVGFSIHAGSTVNRFHYVSLERKVVLDEGRADFVAELK